MGEGETDSKPFACFGDVEPLSSGVSTLKGEKERLGGLPIELLGGGGGRPPSTFCWRARRGHQTT